MYNNGTNVIKQKDPVSSKSTKYSNAVQSQTDMAAGGKLIKPHCQRDKKKATQCKLQTQPPQTLYTHTSQYSLSDILKHESYS